MNSNIKKRIRQTDRWLHMAIFAAGYFVAVLLVFLVIQKPIFIGYAVPDNLDINARTFLDIYRHGFSLDLAGSAYISFIPMLLVVIGVWLPKLKTSMLLSVYNVVAALILSLVSIADAALYPFWGFKIDSTVLLYIGDLDKLSQNVSWYFLIFGIIAVINLCLFIWYWLQFICKALGRSDDWTVSLKWKAAQSVEFVIVAGLLFICARGIQIWPKTPANAYYSEVQFLNHAGVNPLFNFVYSLSHQGKQFTEFRFFDSTEVSRDVREWYNVKADSIDSVINQKRPDILLLTVEGMGACFIEELGGMSGVTPNMGSLIGDSYAFTNCYASSFRTDRGLVAILSGFPAQPTTSAMRYPHVVHSLPGLPRSLAEHAGYHTVAMLGGDASFFNMREYLSAVGHQRIIDIRDFPDSVKTTKWGVPDHSLFERAVVELNDKSQSGPKFTFILTQSSHTPFDVPYHKLEDEKLNAFAYTDNAIGDFLRELSRTPAWKNLMVVITADHGFLYGEFNDPDHHHIPLIITGGAVGKKCNDPRIVSQNDIPAIILGQLRIPHQEYEYSRNVLSTGYTYPFSFSTYNNGFTFRDSTGVTVFDNVTEKVVHFPDSVRERKGKEILQSVYETLHHLNTNP